MGAEKKALPNGVVAISKKCVQEAVSDEDSNCEVSRIVMWRSMDVCAEPSCRTLKAVP